MTIIYKLKTLINNLLECRWNSTVF